MTIIRYFFLFIFCGRLAFLATYLLIVLNTSCLSEQTPPLGLSRCVFNRHPLDNSRVGYDKGMLQYTTYQVHWTGRSRRFRSLKILSIRNAGYLSYKMTMSSSDCSHNAMRKAHKNKYIWRHRLFQTCILAVNKGSKTVKYIFITYWS